MHNSGYHRCTGGKSDLSLLILLAILEILMNRFYKNKYAYTA
jgi:hypothetical protein